MRIAISVTMLTLLTLGGCQSTGDDADAVPASAIPPGMASSVTVPGGAPVDIADLVNATAASGQSQLLGTRLQKDHPAGPDHVLVEPDHDNLRADRHQQWAVPDDRGGRDALLRILSGKDHRSIN